MNAPAPIITLEEAHQRAVEEANQWRGRLINLFAKAECAITRALSNSLPDNKIPILLSQKISRLREARSSDERLVDCLKTLETRLDERNSLVHGEGQVWLNRRGGWQLQLCHQVRSGITEFTLCGDEAKSGHDDLHKLVQRLSAKLKA